MCAQNAFGYRACLEQGEAEQNGVAHNAPNRVDCIAGNGNVLNQYRVDGHTDQDQKALKTQRKQGFQIVLPDVALLMVASGCHRNGGKAHHAINLDHSAVDNDKNDDGQDSHGNADEERLQEQPEQRANFHLHHAGFQH
jgi:hypothetical protein